MLAVPLAGALEATGDPWLPFDVRSLWRPVVVGVGVFPRLAGRGSIGCDAALLWDGSAAVVPVSVGGRGPVEPGDTHRGPRFLPLDAGVGQAFSPALAQTHEVPDRSSTAVAYAASVRAHAETVLRGFYEFHLAAGSGPIVNPFPLHRSRRGRRAHAHHNPMEPHRKERTGLYRPTVPSRIPRSIPDEEFNEIFARLPSNRDRALVAFYVSTGARASELLSATRGDVDPGRQVIAVVRKGTRADTGTAGLDRRVRVAAAVSGRDGRSDPEGKTPAIVVDDRERRCGR